MKIGDSISFRFAVGKCHVNWHKINATVHYPLPSIYAHTHTHKYSMNTELCSDGMWEFMMIAHKMPHENVFDDDAKNQKSYTAISK